MKGAPQKISHVDACSKQWTVLLLVRSADLLLAFGGMRYSAGFGFVSLGYRILNRFHLIPNAEVPLR
jgi:hypothetical protein